MYLVLLSGNYYPAGLVGTTTTWSLGAKTDCVPKRVSSTAPKAAMLNRKGSSHPMQLTTGILDKLAAIRVKANVPKPAEKAGCHS